MTESERPGAPDGDQGGNGATSAPGRDVELERLQLEVEQRRSHQASGTKGRRRRSIPWRSEDTRATPEDPAAKPSTGGPDADRLAAATTAPGRNE
jgi:hypothetical protein